METVNKDMREAEKHLTALERCCGCCTCPGSKVANFEDTDKYQSTWTKTEETVVTGQPTSSGLNNSGVTREQQSVGGNQAMIQKITGDEREDEMEQNLQAVRGINICQSSFLLFFILGFWTFIGVEKYGSRYG